MPDSSKAMTAVNAKIGTVIIMRHAVARFRERAITVTAKLPDEQLLNRLKSSFARARIVNMPRGVSIRRLRKHHHTVAYLEDLEEGIWFVVSALKQGLSIITAEPAKDRRTGEALFKK